MNHRKKGRKFGRETSHRIWMLINMAKSLAKRKGEYISTTLPKAKELRPIMEKLITLGKNKCGDTLHTRRLLIKKLKCDDSEVINTFLELGAHYIERNGGYLRIIKTGFRKGDGAPTAIIQFV